MPNASVGKTINQHYVPRMYMKRFGYGTNDNPKISVLRKQDGHILDNQNPENFASKRFFYDVPREEIEKALKTDFEFFPELKAHKQINDSQFVEHALSRAEWEYKKILDAIEKDPTKIYENHTRAVFISFVHELAYRTRSCRDGMDSISTKTEAWISEICDNTQLDDETKKKTLEENCIPGRNTQIGKIVSIGETIQTMQMLLGNYNWFVGINNTGLDFVISDNPAQTVWMGFNDICIPVSKKIAIILRVDDKDAPMISIDNSDGDVIYMSVKGVVAYNTLQLSMAQMYVLGSQSAIKYMKNINDLLNTLSDQTSQKKEY